MSDLVHLSACRAAHLLLYKVGRIVLPNIIKPCESICRSMLELGIAEQRLVLTGDRQVLQQRDCAHVYLVHAIKKKDQLGEVVAKFAIVLDTRDIMSRCTHCGGSFLPRPLRFAELPPECSVPEGVHNKFDEFWVCGVCKKAFWQGGQYDHAVQQLTKRCVALGGASAARKSGEGARRDTLSAAVPHTPPDG